MYLSIEVSSAEKLDVICLRLNREACKDASMAEIGAFGNTCHSQKCA